MAIYRKFKCLEKFMGFCVIFVVFECVWFTSFKLSALQDKKKALDHLAAVYFE